MANNQSDEIIPIPTANERLELRERIRELAQRHGSKLPWSYKFTCDDCQLILICPFSYDDYNTDGDCLELK